MPQDNQRTESQPAENPRSESSRCEHFRSERPATTTTGNTRFAEIGAKNVRAGLRMQKEMFDTLHDISRDGSRAPRPRRNLLSNCRID